MATNYLSQRSTILFQNNGSLIGAGYVYTADRHGNPSWTNSLSLNTVTYSTILGSSITGVSSIHAYTILGSTVTVSTLTLASTIVSLGQSTNQTYYGQTNGVYTTGWGSTLNTLTSNVKQVAMGSLGNYQIAVCGASTANSVYVTQNSGQTWSTLSAATGLPLAASTLYTSGAISATGQYGILATTGGYSYVTSSFGATYANVNPNVPVIYLPFNNSPVSGVNGNTTLTVVGSPGVIQGVVGANALNFINPAGGSGTQHITGTCSLGANFTVSMWFNAQSAPDGQMAMFTISAALNSSSLFLFLISASGNLLVQYLNQSSNYVSMISYPISFNKWYNLTAIIQSGGTSSVYLNNILIGTSSFTLYSTNNTNFTIARITESNPSNQAFNGYIDDLKIYNSAIAFNPMVPMNYNLTAVSGNGQYMLASVSNGGLFMSNNFGSTWSQVQSVANQGAWSSLALSYTGQYMTATQLVTTGIMPQLTGLTGNTSSSTPVATTWTSNGVTWTSLSSSVYNGNFQSWVAFNNIFSGNTQPYSWAGSGPYTNATNAISTYVTSNTTSTSISGIGIIKGDWIQIQSSVPLVMNSYSFACGAPNQIPHTFYIVGSNDGTTWYPIQYVVGNSYVSPFTTAGVGPTSTYLVNYSGTQTISYAAVTPVTTVTSTYSTTTNPYTYFRLVATALYQGATYVEIEEWAINFTSGGQSYSTDYGSTWTNLNKMSISNALSMSENGQYLLGASGAVTTNNMPNMTGLTGDTTTATPVATTWTSNGVTWTSNSSSVITNHQAWIAFNTVTNTSTGSYSYASAGNYNTNGTYKDTYSTSVSSVGTVKGEWLQLQSSVPLIMNSYSFGYATYGNVPLTYYIVGSNDNSTWYPIQLCSAISANPIGTTSFISLTNYIMVNVSGTQQLISSAATVNGTFTTFPTTTNAYTYFRIICMTTFPTTYNNFELCEWFINFTNPNPLQSAYILSNTPSGLSTNANTAISTINGNILATSLSNTGQCMALTVGTSLIYGEWVQLQLATGASITSYVIAMRGNYPLRFPVAWKLIGSSDGINWTILDTQTNNNVGGTIYTLQTASPIYSYFRIVITQINTTTVVNIAGFILYNNSNPIFTQPTTTSAIAPYSLSGTYSNILSLNSVVVCTVTWSWPISASANSMGIINDFNLNVFYPGMIVVANANNNTGHPNGAYHMFIGFVATLGASYEYNSSYVATQCTYTSSVNPNLYYSTNYGSTFTGVSLGSAPLVSCSMSYDGSYITAASATTVYTLNSNGTGYSLAVGSSAGAANQAQNAIALGNSAGQTNQTANSIILNASGSALNSYSQGFYVAPIAGYLSSTSSYYNLLGYGADNQVVHCSNALVLTNAGYVGIGVTNPAYALDVNGIIRTQQLQFQDSSIQEMASQMRINFGQFGQNWAQVTSGLPSTGSYYGGGAAISSSGQYMTVVYFNGPGTAGYIYVSSNYGQTWVLALSTATYTSQVAMSSSGQYQLVNNATGTLLYYSNTYGQTWSSQTPNSGASTLNWCAMSSTGQYQILTYGSSTTSSMYLSTNYGLTWSPMSTSTGSCGGVAMSGTGQYISAFYSGALYYSSNYGQTWTSSGVTTGPQGLSMSYSGQYQLLAYNAGGIYTSSNYGQSFQLSSSGSGANFRQCSMSASGQYMFAAVINSSSSWYSSNYGQTWTSSSSMFNSVAISYSGHYSVGITNATVGGVFLSILPNYVLGNMGIGMTNPVSTLDVNGTITTRGSISFNNGVATMNTGLSSNTSIPYINFNTDVLIGWSNYSNTNYNDVHATTTNALEGISLRGANNGCMVAVSTTYIPILCCKIGTNITQMIRFIYASAIGAIRVDIGSISHNTTSVAYNTTSDRRLKENIQDVTNARNMIDKLRPRTFNFINDEEKEWNVGFIAQEVQENYPQYISGKETDTTYLQIDYGKISPFAIAACKELYTLVDMQAAKIALQSSEITSLQSQLIQVLARLDAANIA